MENSFSSLHSLGFYVYVFVCNNWIDPLAASLLTHL